MGWPPVFRRPSFSSAGRDRGRHHAQKIWNQGESIMRLYPLLAAAFIAGSSAVPHDTRAAADKTLGIALMSAIVDFQGTLISGSGATAASRTSEGQYTVMFDRDVSACTFAA